tara:strand:- start:99 stop:275 length:177 start_codon:yes stop_codon:yes gene_type:complete
VYLAGTSLGGIPFFFAKRCYDVLFVDQRGGKLAGNRVVILNDPFKVGSGLGKIQQAIF